MPLLTSPLSLEASSRAERLVGGPRAVVLCLVAVPPAVVALASDGWTRALSALICAVGLALVPASLFARRLARFVPTGAGIFLLLTVLTLPFNSVAFVVDIWAAFTMLLVSLPKRVIRNNG
jgi:hypothetical protein